MGTCQDSCFLLQRISQWSIKRPGAMGDIINIGKTDSNHNNVPAKEIKVQQASLPDVVKEGSYAETKLLVESGADLDEVDDAGDSALHIAVATGQYNTTVLLLNRGCSLEVENEDGLTARQMADKINGRTVFVMAMQLTEKSRVERERRDEKQKLLHQEKERLLTEEMDTLDSEDEETDFRKKSNKLLTSQQSLASAKKLVEDLESQVTAAKSLVNRLEMDVHTLQREVEKSKRKKKSSTHNNAGRSDLSSAILTPCSVCLEVPKPPLKVFQCPEGHIFCEICQQRPELTACPECRVSLVGLEIRNRTLEQLIMFSTQT